MKFARSLALLASITPAPLITFPTANRALLEGSPEEFFMYVDRNFEGVASKPWQGGQYGFVRGPLRINGHLLFTALHEGIDIKPIHRTPHGEPLDEIYAAADGKVVHISPSPAASNYGRYLVIEHTWENSPIYTLYAHLASIAVQPGQKVHQGQPIARLGYSGAGINRERAHLHFEVCLMLSDSFDDWHARHFPEQTNRHGLYNGLNLAGLDPTRLLLDAHADPALSLSQFVRAGEPFFRIAIPHSPSIFILRAYPWLINQQPAYPPPAWEITFSRYGIPIAATPLQTPTPQPRITWAQKTKFAYQHFTRGLLSGPSGSPQLTASGRRFIELIAGKPWHQLATQTNETPQPPTP